MSVEIQDYVPGVDPVLQDPTDPNETVERALIDKLAKLITFAEETLQAGDAMVDPDVFVMRRGDFLDALGDPAIQTWLQSMRVKRRAPFPRVTLAKEDPEPEADDAEPN